MTKLRHWTTLILAPLWRWRWLLLFCLLFTIGYSVFSSAEVRSCFDDDALATSILNLKTANFGHGWPFIFEQRWGDDQDSLETWLIWSNVQKFAVVPLLLNLAIAIGLSLAATYFVAWRYAGSQRWQFRLAELLVVTFFVAGLFGVARRLESNFQHDERYLADQTTWHWSVTRQGPPTWYLRPFCDLRLVSEEAAYGLVVRDSGPPVPIMKRLRVMNHGEFNQIMIQAAQHGEGILGRVTILSISSGPLDDDGVAAILDWAPDCSELKLAGDDLFTDKAVAEITERMPRMRSLTLGSPYLTKQALQSLSGMTQLEMLDVNECADSVSPEDLQTLGGCSRLADLAVPFDLFKKSYSKSITTPSNRNINLSPSLNKLGVEPPWP